VSALIDARSDVAELLATAGIPVVLDPREFTPPGVLLDYPSTIDPVGRAGYRLTIPVLVVAAGPGNDTAVRWALGMVEDVLTVFAGRAAAPALFQVFPWQGNQLAAYSVNVTYSIPTYKENTP
jgi:hypothetical protein